MKKMTAVLMTMMLLALPASMSFAQTGKVKAEKKAAIEIVKGEVVSIDAAKSEVVIKDEATSSEKTLTVENKDQLTALKVGDKVKARVKAGTTTAENVVVKSDRKKSHKSKK